jgi:hypothetical protein
LQKRKPILDSFEVRTKDFRDFDRITVDGPDDQSWRHFLKRGLFSTQNPYSSGSIASSYFNAVSQNSYASSMSLFDNRVAILNTAYHRVFV